MFELKLTIHLLQYSTVETRNKEVCFIYYSGYNKNQSKINIHYSSRKLKYVQHNLLLIVYYSIILHIINNSYILII